MEDILINTRAGVRRGPDVWFLCPSHNDHNPSARFNYSKRLWFCDVCGAKGNEKQLSELLMGTTTPSWNNQPIPIQPLEVRYDETYVSRCGQDLFGTVGQTALDYLGNKRGLPFDTIRRFELGYDTNRMAVSIPIRHPETGELTGIKYRHIDPNHPTRYTAAPGTKPTFFGFDPRTTQRDQLVLFEGELDCISSQVLLPGQPCAAVMGVSNWQPEWSKICGGFERIIIAFDPDAAGEKRAVELAKILGPHRCCRLGFDQEFKSTNGNSTPPSKEYLGFKDINDALVGLGVERSRELYEKSIKEAIPMGPPLVAPFNHFLEPMLEYYRTGAYKGLSTGFPELDELFGGFKPGSITMLMAYPGDGKTTLGAAIAHKVMTLHNMPVGIGSFDTPPATTVMPKIMSFHTNRNIDVEMRDNKMTIGDLEQEAKNLGMKDKMYWLLPEETGKIGVQKVLDGVRLAYKKGIRFILIDYLQIMVDETDLSNVKDTMAQLKSLRKELPEVIILLIVQPKRKTGENIGNERLLSMQDMKGGSVIEEAADTILVLDGKKYIRTVKVRSDIVLCPTESKVPMSFNKKQYHYVFGRVQTQDGSDECSVDWNEVL